MAEVGPVVCRRNVDLANRGPWQCTACTCLWQCSGAWLYLCTSVLVNMCTCTWCLYSNSGGACRPLCSNQLTSASVHFHTWASRDIKQSGDIFQSL